MSTSYLKSADWRWKLAFLLNNSLNAVLSLDPIVYFILRIMKAKGDRNSRSFIQDKYPDIVQVYNMGSLNLDTPTRCLLDIQILLHLDNAEILRNISWITSRALQFYKAAFFDIDEHRDDLAWLLQYVFLPARQAKKLQLYRCRKLASKHGLAAAKYMYKWGLASSPVKDLLKSMYNTQRIKNAFDYVALGLRAPMLIRASIMLTSISKINDRDFHKLIAAPLNVQNQTILLMTKNILQAVRTYTQAERTAALLNPVDNSMDTIRNIIKQTNTQEDAE